MVPYSYKHINNVFRHTECMNFFNNLFINGALQISCLMFTFQTGERFIYLLWQCLLIFEGRQCVPICHLRATTSTKEMIIKHATILCICCFITLNWMPFLSLPTVLRGYLKHVKAHFKPWRVPNDCCLLCGTNVLFQHPTVINIMLKIYSI